MPYATVEQRRRYTHDWSMRNRYDQCACGNRKAKKSEMCARCRAANFPQPNRLSESEAAWIAGILEGEGSWSAKAGRRNWTVSVRMTDRDIIERLQKLTGIGRFYVEESPKGYKTSFVWSVAARPHREWLTTAVWPWLGSRRQQKILALWPGITAAAPWLVAQQDGAAAS
jgi:hypothetical protein